MIRTNVDFGLVPWDPTSQRNPPTSNPTFIFVSASKVRPSNKPLRRPEKGECIFPVGRTCRGSELSCGSSLNSANQAPLLGGQTISYKTLLEAIPTHQSKSTFLALLLVHQGFLGGRCLDPEVPNKYFQPGFVSDWRPLWVFEDSNPEDRFPKFQVPIHIMFVANCAASS